MSTWSAHNCAKSAICHRIPTLAPRHHIRGIQDPRASRLSGHSTTLRAARLCKRRGGQAMAASRSTAPEAELPKRSYAKSWCNPSGAVLTPIAENVWAAERPFIWNGIDVGGCGAVIRLSDGTIWTQSPVELTPELRDAINSLGTLKHIVSPNYEHIKFARQWKEEWPGATMYGCPGLMAKKPAEGYEQEVGDESPASWLGEIEAAHMSHEAVPIFNVPFFSEVVFFHKPSKILITTDLFWDYPGGSGIPFGTKLWKFGMDQIYSPFYNRLMIGNAAAFQQAMKRVFGWDFDAILPCHGNYVASGGKAKLRDQLRTALDRTPFKN